MPDPNAVQEVEKTPNTGDAAGEATVSAPPLITVQADSLRRYFLPGEDGPFPEKLRWV